MLEQREWRGGQVQPDSQCPVGMLCHPPGSQTSTTLLSQHEKAEKELIGGAAHYQRPSSDTAVQSNDTP